jgi:demethylmenaquinone methyltransferase/2-methoxy-6-polyprenyl-1,4-benzoquinol methylase
MLCVTHVSPGGEPDKRGAVNRMFDRIAVKYDLMNLVMSLGLDGRFRKRTAQAAGVPEGGLVLDIGAGTGDLTLAALRAAPGSRAFGLDYTAQMLRRAPRKLQRHGLQTRSGWVRADALVLPFGECTFDAVMSAFVLRNLTDLGVAYREMARVVRPGGRVVALEMSPSEAPIWGRVFGLYLQDIVPLMGMFVAGETDAYDYFQSSISAFVTPDEVARIMSQAGLVALRPISLVLGSVVIHIGVRPT